jgi:hypothetical protein
MIRILVCIGLFVLFKYMYKVLWLTMKAVYLTLFLAPCCHYIVASNFVVNENRCLSAPRQFICILLFVNWAFIVYIGPLMSIACIE